MCDLRGPILTLVVATGCVAAAQAAPGPEKLVDPTLPPVVHQSAVRRLEEQQPQEFTVSAIKISGATRKALVNGQFVGEGDTVGDARVLEIAADAVVMEYLSEQSRVALLPRKIRRPVSGP